MVWEWVLCRVKLNISIKFCVRWFARFVFHSFFWPTGRIFTLGDKSHIIHIIFLSTLLIFILKTTSNNKQKSMFFPACTISREQNICQFLFEVQTTLAITNTLHLGRIRYSKLISHWRIMALVHSIASDRAQRMHRIRYIECCL